MPSSTWPLQDAKSHFGALVDAASQGKAQVVTKDGKPAVVVVADAEYARLRDLEHAARLLSMRADDGSFSRLGSRDPKDSSS